MDKNSRILLIVFLTTIILATFCAYVRTIYYKNFDIVTVQE
jgi:hypothetical protein